MKKNLSVKASTIFGKTLEFLFQSGPTFASLRTHARALSLATGVLLNAAKGRRMMITNILRALGKDRSDPGAYYKFSSTREWDENALFEPIVRSWISQHREKSSPKILVAAIDDTYTGKTGKKIPYTQYFRDPMSPPFHQNLIWALRQLVISGIFFEKPFPKPGAARAVPLELFCCPRPGKLPRNATEDQKRWHKELTEKMKLSNIVIQQMRRLRAQADRLGAKGIPILFAGDGAITNKHIYKEEIPGVILISRCRKDTALYFPYEGEQRGRGKRRKYGKKAPTPEELRKDQSVEWKTVEVFYSSKLYQVRYKSLKEVLWKSAGGRKVRVIVIAGLPYYPPGSKRRRYRRPCYLLSTADESISDEALVRAYLTRVDIETNIKDLKQIFGIGDPQVWSERSVVRLPAFLTAVYSAMLTASIELFGHRRGENYPEPARWIRKSPGQRPSTRDILSRVELEMKMIGHESVLENFEGFLEEIDLPRTHRKYPGKRRRGGKIKTLAV